MSVVIPYLAVSTHAPLRLQLRGEVVFREDHVAGDARDAVGAFADGVVLDLGDAAAVAADAACVAHVLGVFESLGRGKV